jgi:rifampicin phosphotransferase
MDSTAPLVLPFGQLSRASLPIAGGKAASLGEMTRAGFPVPPGFCVTTAAYRLAAGQSGLAAVLQELEGVPGTELEALSKLAERARAALRAAEVPEVVRAACAAAYRDIAGPGGNAPVAVRSSATAEDLPDASFAGQHETLLNVVGEKALLDAVRECWSSLFTERAVVYRAQRGIQHGSVHLAVAVQRMVDAAVAGVMFTANPITGRRTEVVIDASPGLGEAIVSGAVNPDHFVLSREGRAVVEERLGDKKLRIESVPGGGTREVRSEGGAAEACVTGAELAALCELGEKAEAHYGAPQDLEWALDRARRPLLLQSRPITTLYPLEKREGPLTAFFSVNVAQGVFGPLTPMGVQAFRLMGTSVATVLGMPPADPLKGPSPLYVAGERLWFDMGTPLRTRLGRTLAQFAIARMEARSLSVMKVLLDDPRFSVRPASKGAVAGAVARLVFRVKIPVAIVRALISPARARALAQRTIAEQLAQGDVPEGATPTQKLDALVRLLTSVAPRMLGKVMPAAAVGMGGIAVARKLLGPLASGAEIDGALRALPYNPTTEMDLELWGVADEIGRAGGEARQVFRDHAPAELARRYRERALPQVVLEAMDRFLGRYGVRAVAEIDLGVARWREDPAHLLGSVANYLVLREQPDAVPPDEQFRRASKEADTTVATLVDRAERAGEWKGTLVKFVLSRVRQLAGLRELIKFGFVKILARGRALVLDVGAALVKEGRLDAADDAVFLDVKELRRSLAGEDLRALVRERKAARARELGRRHIPRVMLSDGTDVEATLPRREGLVGTAASAGTVTATARVVMDPVGAKLEPGEILVAPSTDPGWTPLFLTAAGLVMEMGGAMSHGAVVAREYGIPAVVGVANATAAIKTGQKITVDGGAGVVSLA